MRVADLIKRLKEAPADTQVKVMGSSNEPVVMLIQNHPKQDDYVLIDEYPMDYIFDEEKIKTGIVRELK